LWLWGEWSCVWSRGCRGLKEWSLAKEER
jgi:hypothetical protein